MIKKAAKVNRTQVSTPLRGGVRLYGRRVWTAVLEKEVGATKILLLKSPNGNYKIVRPKPKIKNTAGTIKWKFLRYQVPQRRLNSDPKNQIL